MARPKAGRLAGISAEPGTILGPMWTNELLVVLEDHGDGVTVGYATQDEIDAASQRDEPRSLTERKLIMQRKVLDIVSPQ